MTRLHESDDQCEAGRAIMADRTVTICGLVRDCAQSLRRLIPQVERLGSAFRSHRIIVVENDSRDETGDLVEAWAQRNDSVHSVRFCYVERGQKSAPGWFGQSRINRIAFARNVYLDEVEQQAPAGFVIMIDMDIRSFDLQGVEKSFARLDHWDVLTANGTRYSRRHPFRTSVYWDAYAFEPAAGFHSGVQTEDTIKKSQCQIADDLKNHSLVPARSAFGGLGIYRAEFLRGHRYCALKNADQAVPVLSEHHGLHRSIREHHPDLRLMIHSALRVDYGSLAHLARYTLKSLFTR